MAADATIASAAARAGMAGAPVDLSQTFQNTATGYSAGMRKMGKGLAMAAAVGAQAADGLVKDVKKAKETYGSNWMNTVYGEMKSLVRDGVDIFKNQSSLKDDEGNLQTQKFEDATETGGGTVAEQKAAAKLEWKKKKSRAFGTFKKMRDGTLGIEEALLNGTANLGALSASNSLIAQGLVAKGDGITEGKYKGCVVEMEPNADGDGYSFNVYGPNGKKVSGVNEETGDLQYTDGSDAVDALAARAERSQSLNKPAAGYYKSPDSSGVHFTGDDGSTISFEGPNAEADYYAHRSAQGAPRDFTGIKVVTSAQVAEAKAYEAPPTLDEYLGALSSTADRTQLSVTADSVGELIVTKEPERLVALNNIDIQNMENGTLGMEFRENEVRNDIRAQIDTPNSFRDLTHTNLANMQHTYAEQLGMPNQWSNEMLMQVQQIGEDGLIKDTNNDGVFNADDFQDSDIENFKALRKEMLNPDNLNSKELFIDWYTNGVRETHQSGFDRYSAAQGSGKKSAGTSGFPAFQKGEKIDVTGTNKWVPEATVTDVGIQVRGRKDFRGFTWNSDQNTYLAPDGSVVENKDALYTQLFGEISSEFSLNPAYSDIPDWQASGGGGGSGGGLVSKTQIGQIKSVFGGEFREGKAVTKLEAILNMFDLDLEQSDIFSGYKFTYDGVEYDLNLDSHADLFITHLQKYNDDVEEDVDTTYAS